MALEGRHVLDRIMENGSAATAGMDTSNRSTRRSRMGIAFSARGPPPRPDHKPHGKSKKDRKSSKNKRNGSAANRKNNNDDETADSNISKNEDLQWMDALDSCGMELFGCDDEDGCNSAATAGRKVLADALQLSSGACGGGQHHSSRGGRATSSLSSSPPFAANPLGGEDYAKKHDEFLESLLHEQTVNNNNNNLDDDSLLSAFSFSTQNTEQTNLTAGTHRAPLTVTSMPPVSPRGQPHPGNADGPCDSTAAATIPRKRRRPVRLSRKVSPTRALAGGRGANNGKKNSAAAPAPAKVTPLTNSSSSFSSASVWQSRYDEDEGSIRSGNITKPLPNSSESAVTVSMAELSKSEFPEPSTYVHPHCRLQKDKGKGEPAGSNICAKGLVLCMEKLRSKMHLLMEVAFNSADGSANSASSIGSSMSRGSSATMKRRKARVAQHCENFCETRSVIELKMGFLSLQYGVLLRWDTGRTGQITLVVLRKMCNESFYPAKCRGRLEIPALHLSSSTTTSETGSSGELAYPYPDHGRVGRKGDQGMELSLLKPPYLVSRPVVFDASKLSVQVLFASGLSRRSTSWTVQLIYNDLTENIVIAWDNPNQNQSRTTSSGNNKGTHGSSKLVPKLGDPLKYAIPHHKHRGQEQLNQLEIKLYEHRVRHRFYRRLIACMKVPLKNLEPQPLGVEGRPTQLKVPCEHDPDAFIALECIFQSDYACWAKQEIEARRRYEERTDSDGNSRRGQVSGLPFSWLPFSLSGWEEQSHDRDDEENHDPWDWICCVDVC